MLSCFVRMRLATSATQVKNVNRLKRSVELSRLVRCYSDKQSGSQASTKDQAKLRRAYALGGCLVFIWISTHGILLYRRRSEFRQLNEKLPPIKWEEFVDKFLSKGEVKTVVFQPQFGVGNVYLTNATEQQMKKTIIDWFHATPDKFSRAPDVRFCFYGDQSELQQAILVAQKSTADSGLAIEDVELSVDQFPSYRELSFIAASTLFTLAAVTLMK